MVEQRLRRLGELGASAAVRLATYRLPLGRPKLGRVLELLVVVVFGLSPLVWFHDDLIINGADINFPADPSYGFWLRTYVWAPLFQGGGDRSPELTVLFFSGVWAVLDIAGLSQQAIQKASFTFWFVLPGLAMYWFLAKVLRDVAGPVARVIGSIFYMHNFFVASAWSGVRIADLGVLVLLPAMLTAFIMGIEGRWSRTWVWAVVTALALVGMGGAANPPIFAAYLGIFPAYLIFHLISRRRSAQRGEMLGALGFFGFFTATYLVASLFWLLPVLNDAIRHWLTLPAVREVGNTEAMLVFTSRWLTPLNVVRLMSSWWFWDSWGGATYYPALQDHLTNPALIVTSFIVPILGYFGLVSTRSRLVLFVAAVGVVGAYLAQGLNSPLGPVYRWLTDHVPAFWIFRDPFQKFGIHPLLAYAVLGGLGAQWLFKQLRSRSPKGSPLFAAAALTGVVGAHMAYMWPAVAGEIFPAPGERTSVPAIQVRVPEYINQAAEYLNKDPELSRVLLLPDKRTSVYKTADWEYGGPVDISFTVLKRPIVFRQFGEGAFALAPQPIENVYAQVVWELYRAGHPLATKLLGLLNVRYVLQRNDFAYDFYGGTDSPEFIREQLSRLQGVSLDRSFGAWDIYRVDEIAARIQLLSGVNVIGEGDVLVSSYFAKPDYCPCRDAWYLAGVDPDEDRKVEKIFRTSLPAFPSQAITAPVLDGRQNPFVWSGATPASTRVEARRYPGSWPVYSGVPRSPREPFTLTYADPTSVPHSRSDWGSFDSTLVFVETGPDGLQLSQILEGGASVADIIGIWWRAGGYQPGTQRPPFYEIPPGERAIIQINHLVQADLTLEVREARPVQTLALGVPEDAVGPRLAWRRINPSKYAVEVVTEQPFVLLFSESFDSQWRVLAGKDGPVSFPQSLFRKQLAEANHFHVNGWANGWFIDEVGSYTLTIEYASQNLFYLGLVILLVDVVALGATIALRVLRGRRGDLAAL